MKTKHSTRSPFFPGRFPAFLLALVSFAAIGISSGARRDYSLPMLDLNPAKVLFTTVDRSEEYLGQVSSVLFRDGKTLLAAYPAGHGHGKLILSRSIDAGNSWKRVDIPDQQVGETPTLYRLDLPGGKERVLLVTCQPKAGVLEWMESDDFGSTWTERRQWKLEGTRGIIVALASLWPVQGEPMKWRGVFHDFDFNNYTVDLSLEEGAGNPCRFDHLRKIEFASQAGSALSRQAGLCEAGLVTRPDGKRIALLFRPEKRSHNSMVSFSDDSGLTWTDPKELPGALTGHRHESVNLKDGRTIVFMRDFSPLNQENPSHGDWIAWVGTFDDIEQGREGQYRIHLRKNYGSSLNGSIGDCGYSGVELLPDGRVLALTYGHWERDESSTAPTVHPEGRGKPPFLYQIRFDPAKADQWVKKPELLVKKTGPVTLARPFGDGMVVSMNKEIPVWGTADPGKEVEVRFGGQTARGKAGNDGVWRVKLPAMAASATGRDLEIRAGNQSRVVKDVLVGKVWLCSGQSNMDFPLNSAVGGRQEAQNAGKYEAIRLCNLSGAPTDARVYDASLLARLNENDHFQGIWKKADHAGEISAIAWWAARLVHERDGVPIGIVENAVGGSGTEAWIPRSVLLSRREYRPLTDDSWLESKWVSAWARGRAKQNLGTNGKANHPFRPGFLFESGVKPWAGFPFDAVLWYQGETNAEIDDKGWNEKLIRDLISGWRQELLLPDLPFVMVQLPRIGGNDPLRKHWPEYRDVQARVARAMKNVELIVTQDLGWDSPDVHPPDKLPVAERIAGAMAK